MSVVNTQSGVNNVYHYPAFNPIVNLNRLFRVPLTILQRSATRLSSKSYRAPWAFAAGEARLIKRALWSRRVLKMTFVVAGISFSKFQSMNLIISVSQSSAWDACCLISLHRGGGGKGLPVLHVDSQMFIRVSSRVQRGVKRGRTSKARSKPISQQRGADSSSHRSLWRTRPETDRSDLHSAVKNCFPVNFA